MRFLRRREMLFRRIGRILRRVEQQGFSHFDAKASNWIVRDDEKLGPGPVLIDVDGVRQRPLDCVGNSPASAQPAGSSAVHGGRFAGAVPGLRAVRRHTAPRVSPRERFPPRRPRRDDLRQCSDGPISRPPERILIIKPSAIGDIVHALPVLNLIRRRWSDAHITWLVTPACASLVEGHPQIDEVMRFDRHGLGSAWRSPKAALQLFGLNGEFRRRQFDLVVDLQGLFRSGWFLSQTRAPLRVGFANAREFGWLFYTHRIVSSWEDHAVERYLCIAEALGLGKSPVEFHFAVNEDDRAQIAEKVPDSAPYAVLLPGANWDTKRWPAERFSALVQPIAERFGLRSIVAGGPGRFRACRPDCRGTRSHRKDQPAPAHRAAGRHKLVIAADTGPMHIAAALGKPMVTMYGPTDPIRTGPFGRMDTVVRLDIPCSPCFSRKCSHQSCLQWLGIEPVLSLAEQQIRRAGIPVAST